MKRGVFIFLFSICGIFAMSQKSMDANKMLLYVNKARSADCMCGNEPKTAVAPLIWDDALTKSALKHANDMARRKFFSHTGSDKSTVSQRVDKAGFNWKAVGENLAMGYEEESAAVDGWMGSTGHCKNIMNSEFTHIGAARSRDGKYWVQVFAAKMQ
jgi:uncharacterized protein YkwD